MPNLKKAMPSTYIELEPIYGKGVKKHQHNDSRFDRLSSLPQDHFIPRGNNQSPKM